MTVADALALGEIGARIAGRIVKLLARGVTPDRITVKDVLDASEVRRLRRAANVARAEGGRRPRRP